VAGAIMAVQYKLKPVTIMIALTLFFVLGRFLPANYTERILTLSYFLPQSSSQLNDDSIRGRTSANLAAWEMFKDYPLTGIGISNYQTLYFAYARPLGLDTTAADAEQPHNLYFQILAERGLIGFSVFMIIMFITFKDLYLSKKIFEERKLSDLAGMSSALIISLVIYMFSSLFLHDTYIRYFWILIGIAWSVPTLADNEVNNRYQIAAEL
jgi:putative inorganic carbon (HCO3(-)) transporter